MTNKDTNPKDAVGTKKAPMSTVPTRILFELGLAMLEGARKYGRHNYRVAGVRASVYYDAALRHLASFWEGDDIDPDSGLPHLVKAMACLAVLRDSQNMGNWIDDRPPRLPAGLDLATLNKQAAGIIERYPDAKEPFTQRSTVTKSPMPRPTYCGDCANFSTALGGCTIRVHCGNCNGALDTTRSCPDAAWKDGA